MLKNLFFSEMMAPSRENLQFLCHSEDLFPSFWELKDFFKNGEVVKKLLQLKRIVYLYERKHFEQAIKEENENVDILIKK